jgi:MFS-type transporter involved in bile tolerance (Atg22 family)
MTTYVTSLASVLLLTCFAYTTHETNWVEILVLIGSAMMIMSVSHCFYNSLLLLVTEPGNIVKVQTAPPVSKP